MKWFQRFNSLPLLLVIVISLLALVLRLWNIQTKEFWYDEAYTGILANLPQEKFQALIQYDVHPPVYITLVRWWTNLFGSSDLIIRSLSVIFGVLLIPTSYLLAKSLHFSKKFPLFKFVLPLTLAVNPFFVEYSKEARSYALSALLFSLLFICYYVASKSAKFNLRWLLTAAIIAIAFLTHYLIVLGIICIFTFDLLFTKTAPLSWLKFLLTKTKLYLTIALTTGGLIVWQLPTLFEQYKNAPKLWWIPQVGLEQLPTTFYKFLFGVKTNVLGVSPALTFPTLSVESIGFLAFTVFIGTIGFFWTKYKAHTYRKELVLLIFCSIVPVLATIGLQLFGNRLYLERYLTPYAVFFMVLTLLLVFNFKKLLKYALVSSYILASLYLLLTINYKSTGFAELANQLSSVDTPQTQVIVDDPISFTVAKYYLASNPNLEVKIYNPKENYDDWEIISKEEVLGNYTALKNRQRIFVYTNSDEPDIWYRQSTHIETLYVYSTLPIFEQVLASKN